MSRSSLLCLFRSPDSPDDTTNPDRLRVADKVVSLAPQRRDHAMESENRESVQRGR